MLNEERKGREGEREEKETKNRKEVYDGGPCEHLWRGAGLGSVVVGTHRGSVKGSSRPVLAAPRGMVWALESAG